MLAVATASPEQLLYGQRYAAGTLTRGQARGQTVRDARRAGARAREKWHAPAGIKGRILVWDVARCDDWGRSRDLIHAPTWRRRGGRQSGADNLIYVSVSRSALPLVERVRTRISEALALGQEFYKDAKDDVTTQYENAKSADLRDTP